MFLATVLYYHTDLWEKVVPQGSVSFSRNMYSWIWNSRLQTQIESHEQTSCTYSLLMLFFLFKVQLLHTTPSPFGEPFHIFQGPPEYHSLTKSSLPPHPHLLNCPFTYVLIAFPTNLYFLQNSWHFILNIHSFVELSLRSALSRDSFLSLNSQCLIQCVTYKSDQ